MSIRGGSERSRDELKETDKRRERGCAPIDGPNVDVYVRMPLGKLPLLPGPCGECVARADGALGLKETSDHV